MTSKKTEVIVSDKFMLLRIHQPKQRWIWTLHRLLLCCLGMFCTCSVGWASSKKPPSSQKSPVLDAIKPKEHAFSSQYRIPSTWTKKHCVALYRKRSFLHAALCFETMGLKMKEGSLLPKLKRYEKGQLLRNAAVAYEKMASTQKKIEQASYLRERAVRVLDLYRKESLCESAYRCRIVLDLRTRIFKKIGYAYLAVVVDNKKSTTRIRGYRFYKQSQGNVNIRLRPGGYTVKVTYPGEQPKIAQIQLRPRIKTIKNFMRAQNRVVTVAAIGLYITGFALVAGGGVVMGLGVVNWVEAETTWMNPLTPMTAKGELEQKRIQAQPMIWVGGGGIGLGLTFLVLGMAFHQPRSAKKSAAPPPKKPRLESTIFKSLHSQPEGLILWKD